MLLEVFSSPNIVLCKLLNYPRQNGGSLAAPRTMMRTRWLLLACAWSLASAAPSLHLQMTEQELRHYFGTTELEHIQGDFALRNSCYFLDN